MFLKLDWNLAIRTLSKTGSQIKRAGLAVDVKNKPIPDSCLVPSAFSEYRTNPIQGPTILLRLGQKCPAYIDGIFGHVGKIILETLAIDVEECAHFPETNHGPF